MAALGEYVWLVVAGAIVSFGFGWGTGANDVANAFGTSVGSKTLSLRQASLIAAVFEFSGALLLGRVSTNTIAAGIADIDSFARDPEVYAYGMVCALTVGTLWLIYTSYYGLNVSSTHCIVGGIIGFAMVWDGPKAITWAKKDTAAFPPYKGVIAIMLSWIVAPVLTGAVAALIFSTVRSLVLRRKNAYALAFWTLPPFVFLSVTINMYFIFTKGAGKILSPNSNWSNAKSLWIAAIIAAVVTFFCIVIALPLLRIMAARHFDSQGKPIKSDSSRNVGLSMQPLKAGEVLEDGAMVRFSGPTSTSDPLGPLTTWQKFTKAATHGLNVDIHQIVKEDEKIGEIHEAAETFEPRVEFAFSYLQVFSAVCVIFAHGAGEVGYMAGPMATIWNVYEKGRVSKTIKPPVWIVVICALGLVIGLATYGYNVTRAMGVKLAKITPTRGFAAELATAFVIMIGSQYGLPTSSSQCITGAIIGVGILEGAKGVNWTQFLKQFASWVATLVVIGLFVAILFGQGVYTPCKMQGKIITRYEDRVTNLTAETYLEFSASLQSFKAASDAQRLVNLPPSAWSSLNSTVNDAATAAKNMLNPTQSQSDDPDAILVSLYKSLSLVQNYSIFTLGQNIVFPGANVCIDPSSINASTAAPCQSPKIVPQAYMQ